MFIGITSNFETITDRRGCPAPRFYSPADYTEAVLAAGAQPLLLPHRDPALAPEMLERLDALVIAGGDFDVPPSMYGEEPQPLLGSVLEPRSLFERSLCLAALARDLPVLGICGGMQLLNVVLGGTLFQDLSYRPGTGEHVQPRDRRQPFHAATVSPGSLLERACGRRDLQVNSTHHQLVRDPGQNVRIAAVAPDGAIEAIELTGARFVLGVQWHPEALDDPGQRGIYRALVEAASQHRQRRSA